MAMCF
jgi:hypothetical protein